MKMLIKYISITSILVLFSATTPKAAMAQSVSFQIFYDNLSPYGHWIDYPSYGYVWIPIAGPDFFPYSSNGHWVLTEFGWTWVSYYSWGWAPFHYGRWGYDDYYGWFWIPDNLWGPAWVVWRTSPGYYGWAPLGPYISVNIVIGGRYNPPVDNWVYLPRQYMGRTDSYNYYGPRKSNREFINNSTVIGNTRVDNRTNTSYFAGPRKEEVQEATGSPVKSVEIRESTKPGQSLEKNRLNIYRPAITKTVGRDIKPSEISDKNDVKQISERKAADEKATPAPIRKPIDKTPLQEKPVDPKSTRDKQILPQQQEKSRVKPQQEKVLPKTKPQEEQKMQRAPIKNIEKQPPVQQKTQPKTQPIRERQPVPIPKNIPEQQPKQIRPEPKTNVMPPSQVKPRSGDKDKPRE